MPNMPQFSREFSLLTSEFKHSKLLANLAFVFPSHSTPLTRARESKLTRKHPAPLTPLTPSVGAAGVRGVGKKVHIPTIRACAQ